jgi:hypothetical protein
MLETVLQAAFAVAVLIAAASIGLAVFGRVGTRLLLSATVLLGVAASAGWIAFGFRPERDVAVLAGALTAAALAEASTVLLARAIRRARADENALARARETIDKMVIEETEQITADLQRWLARVRADSTSLSQRRSAGSARSAVQAWSTARRGSPPSSPTPSPRSSAASRTASGAGPTTSTARSRGSGPNSRGSSSASGS